MGFSLSIIERMIFLKQVSCFHHMTLDQLRFLAGVCEEEFFSKSSYVFRQGDPGGSMYVIVMGRVTIEREDEHKASSVRLKTLDAFSYFGEMSLFDQSPRSASVLTAQDTLLLSMRREPLMTLMLQQPDISLEIINMLCERIRATNEDFAQRIHAIN